MATDLPSGTDGQGGNSTQGADDSAPTAVDHPPALPELAPAVGSTIDRFEVLGTLGRGGMGLVLRARDPKLDRHIALKLVRESSDPSVDARFRREAQAMARLSHPNVLPIYDVGVADHVLFIAMELVEGQTLRQWCRSSMRSWQEIVPCFLEAGRGLQAAHEAELVHRDFKPANVMVGDDGRVRVMDFGLARTARGGGSDPERWSGSSSSSLDQSVTRADAVMGTPPYMAPEQHLGEEVDAGCDQYGFCVALWEALYRVVPFAEKDLRALYKAKVSTVPQAPRGTSVPTWLRDIVRRGLAPRREDRFASMAELLAALQQGLDRRRRLRWQLGLGGLAVIGTAAALGWPRPPDPPLCQGAPAKLEGVWDPATRAAVRESVLATEAVYAQGTWERLEPQLDDYAKRWSTGYADACEATHVRGEQTEQQLDARMRCLDRSLAELRATVGTMRRADAVVVEHAIGAVGELPELDACADPKWAQEGEPPQGDPQVLAALEDRLAEAKARERMGDYEGGLRIATEALAEAEALGSGPVVARCALQLGSLLHRLDRNEEAVEPLQRAFFEAERHALGELQIDAATTLMSVLGTGQNKLDEAQTWAKHAEVGIERLGDTQRRATVRSIQGTLHVVGGEYEAALVAHREALELVEARLEPDDPRIASVLNGLGIAYWHHGDYEQALKTHQRALSIWEQALGPEHPVLALSLTNLGNTYAMLEQYEPARAAYTRAVTIREATLGPEHPRLAGTLANLANIHISQGRPQEALELLERATSILEAAHGPEHPSLMHPLSASASAYSRLGRYDRAIATQQRAIAIFERTVGPDHPELGTPLTNLGMSYLELDRIDDAQLVLERALTLRTRGLGERHPDVAQTLVPLGHVDLVRGRYREALVRLDRSISILEESHGIEHSSLSTPLVDKGLALYELGELAQAREVLERGRTLIEGEEDPPLELRATAEFALARVLDELGENPERAVGLARAARRDLRRAPREHGRERAEIDAWLREH